MSIGPIIKAWVKIIKEKLNELIQDFYVEQASRITYKVTLNIKSSSNKNQALINVI